MPYIKQEDRTKFDEGIADILGALQAEDNVKMGDINYVFSAIIWSLFKDNESYTLGNNLVGVLECVKQEFYRRLAAPYENNKVCEHGDVPEFQMFEKKLYLPQST